MGAYFTPHEYGMDTLSCLVSPVRGAPGWYEREYNGYYLTTIQNWRAHLWSRSKAGRYKFLTWILAWRFWGKVAMKSLGLGKVVHAFNPKRLRQGDLWVQGQPGTKQDPDPGMVVHPFNLGHTFCWRLTKGRGKKEDSIFFACLHLLASIICWNLLP